MGITGWIRALFTPHSKRGKSAWPRRNKATRESTNLSYITEAVQAVTPLVEQARVGPALFKVGRSASPIESSPDVVLIEKGITTESAPGCSTTLPETSVKNEQCPENCDDESDGDEVDGNLGTGSKVLLKIREFRPKPSPVILNDNFDQINFRRSYNSSSNPVETKSDRLSPTNLPPLVTSEDTSQYSSQSTSEICLTYYFISEHQCKGQGAKSSKSPHRHKTSVKRVQYLNNKTNGKSAGSPMSSETMGSMNGQPPFSSRHCRSVSSDTTSVKKDISAVVRRPDGGRNGQALPESMATESKSRQQNGLTSLDEASFDPEQQVLSRSGEIVEGTCSKTDEQSSKSDSSSVASVHQANLPNQYAASNDANNVGLRDTKETTHSEAEVKCSFRIGSDEDGSADYGENETKDNERYVSDIHRSSHSAAEPSKTNLVRTTSCSSLDEEMCKSPPDPQQDLCAGAHQKQRKNSNEVSAEISYADCLSEDDFSEISNKVTEQQHTPKPSTSENHRKAILNRMISPAALIPKPNGKIEFADNQNNSTQNDDLAKADSEDCSTFPEVHSQLNGQPHSTSLMIDYIYKEQDALAEIIVSDIPSDTRRTLSGDSGFAEIGPNENTSSQTSSELLNCIEDESRTGGTTQIVSLNHGEGAVMSDDELIFSKGSDKSADEIPKINMNGGMNSLETFSGDGAEGKGLEKGDRCEDDFSKISNKVNEPHDTRKPLTADDLTKAIHETRSSNAISIPLPQCINGAFDCPDSQENVKQSDDLQNTNPRDNYALQGMQDQLNNQLPSTSNVRDNRNDALAESIVIDIPDDNSRTLSGFAEMRPNEDTFSQVSSEVLGCTEDESRTGEGTHSGSLNHEEGAALLDEELIPSNDSDNSENEVPETNGNGGVDSLKTLSGDDGKVKGLERSEGSKDDSSTIPNEVIEPQDTPRPLTVDERRKAILEKLSSKAKSILQPFCINGVYEFPDSRNNVKQTNDLKKMKRKNTDISHGSSCHGNKDSVFEEMNNNVSSLACSVVSDRQAGETAPVATINSEDGSDLQGETMQLDLSDCSDEPIVEIPETNANGGHDSLKTLSGDDANSEGLEAGADHCIIMLESDSETDSDGESLPFEDATDILKSVMLSNNILPQLPTETPNPESKYALQTVSLPSSDRLQTKKWRFRTFGGKIWQLRQPDVSEIVYAGFYYVGPDDCTQCFSCGIVLMEWQEFEVPLEEHLKHSPDCSFVQSVYTPQKKLLSPVIDGAIDIIRKFNTYDLPTIEKAVERLDVKGVYIASTSQLLDELFVIEEDAQAEDEEFLSNIYDLQGATCKDLTEEIERKELPDVSWFKDNGPEEISEGAVEDTEDDIDGLGIGFTAFSTPRVFPSDGTEPALLELHDLEREGKSSINMGGGDSLSGEKVENDIGESDGQGTLEVPERFERQLQSDGGYYSAESEGSINSERTASLSDDLDNGVPNHRTEPLLEVEEDEETEHERQEETVVNESESDSDLGSSSDNDTEAEDEVDGISSLTSEPCDSEERRRELRARLRERNEELRLWSACKVCLVNTVTQLYVNCGHLAVCSSCSDQLRNCPICRERIGTTMTVYLP